MRHREEFPGRSILSWLGLAALVLLVIALIRLSDSGRSTAEPDETSSPPFTTPDLFSPVPSQTSGHASSAVDSPLPASASSPLSMDLGSPLPAASPAAPTSTVPLRLVVFHTNDTWGYLLPCG